MDHKKVLFFLRYIWQIMNLKMNTFNKIKMNKIIIALILHWKKRGALKNCKKKIIKALIYNKCRRLIK